MSASENGVPSRSSRREDDRLLSGRGRYTDDVDHPGALYAAFVRSPYPSARIRSIDTDEAMAYPGVAAVFTSRDLAASGFADMPNPFKLPQGDGSFATETPRPFLAGERVLFVGEPVAMVLADTPSAALDGVERVLVDYEELPVVVGVDEAQAPDAPQLWPDRPGNIGYDWHKGDDAQVQAALDASHRVVVLRSRISRVVAMPMEPRAVLGTIDEDGRPVLNVSHQSPHQFRAEVASRMGMAPEELRVVAGDVGGSFGMKWGPLREEVLVFWATSRLQRAVRWTAQRNESFLSDEHARDLYVHAELGLDAQGRFTALRVRYDVNIGAYMSGRSAPPIFNIGGISGVYTTPVVSARVVGVFTNTQTTTAYRGAGRPDATYAIERIIDVAAAEMGIDPVELRRRNLIPADAMPYQTSFQFRYDCGDFGATMHRALELADYAGFSQRRADALQRGQLRGIGVAMPVEMAGGIGGDWASVRIDPDGGLTLMPGAMSVGQGHETAFVALVSERLGIPASKVRYASGDTDLLQNGKGNGGSSALVMGSSAIIGAAEDLVQNAKALAAAQMEVSVADVEFAAGEFRVAGTDLHVGWDALARAGTPLAGAGAFVPPAPTFPNGCHVCEVEVDPETGHVQLLRYVSVEDIGRVMHPKLVEGQIHGGVAQGIGQSLLEEIRYDDGGQLITGSFMDYAMPRATDIPTIISENLEVPTALNPLGVKGVGEAGTVGALAATTNAICNALAPAGVRHLDMPATPLRVWESLRDAGYGPAVR
jgi:aerobic carbon-monoxide dehydrogenase large subunit